jgi:hypothetical protein
VASGVWTELQLTNLRYVKVVRLYEALEKIPTHLGRLIGALRLVGEDG